MLFNKNLSDQLDKKPGLKPNKKATGQVVHFNKTYDEIWWCKSTDYATNTKQQNGERLILYINSTFNIIHA